MNITCANIWTHHRWKRSTCPKNSTKSKPRVATRHCYCPRWTSQNAPNQNPANLGAFISLDTWRITTGKVLKCPWRDVKKKTQTLQEAIGTHKNHIYPVLWSWCLSMCLLSKNGWCLASSWLSFDVVTAWFNQSDYIGHSYAKVKSPLFRAQSSIHRQILDMTRWVYI